MEHDTSPVPFSDLVKSYRKRIKLTQRQLAAKLDVHYNTVWAWERGDHLPDTKGLVLEIARHLRLSDLETRHLLEASLTALSPYWHVPYQRNPFFTGRVELLTHLHALLCQESTMTQSLALSGLGGIGKTQTALEYAYRHAHAYTALFWITAETLESIVASCAAITAQLPGDERQESDQKNAMARVTQWLVNHRDWLLILDNVEDIRLVQPFLVAVRHGSLLITTRLQSLGAFARSLMMEPMVVEEATALLLSRTHSILLPHSPEQISQEDRTLARSIAMLMDGLPLAIDQAGAYIEATRCGFAEYLEQFQRFPLRFLSVRDSYEEHPLSVARTFKLTYEYVQLREPAAAELLRVCAFLAPDSIPEELLIRGASWLGPLLQALTKDNWLYNAALKELLAYSLLRRNREEKTLSIHRLVQTVIKAELSQEEHREWLGRLLQALDQVFPSGRLATLTMEQWIWCGRLLPHALACITNSEEEGVFFPEVLSVLIKAANYLREQGQYTEAEPLLLRALTLCEQEPDSSHLTLATIANDLGWLYESQGKYEQAEAFYLRALAVYEQAEESFPGESALCLTCLGALYRKQSRYAEAETFLLRALKICEQEFGVAHPRTAQSLNNVAILYGAQKKYAEAEPLFQRALAIREQELGPDHPGVANALNNLATLYALQKKYAEAEPLLWRALEISEQKLGPEHPNTATSLNNIAELYRDQSRYAEAEPLFLRALAIRRQKLGPEHPNTLTTLKNLDSLYQDQGRIEAL